MRVWGVPQQRLRSACWNCGEVWFLFWRRSRPIIGRFSRGFGGSRPPCGVMVVFHSLASQTTGTYLLKRTTGLGVYRFTVQKRSKVYRFTVHGVYRFTVENFRSQETFPQSQLPVSRAVELWV